MDESDQIADAHAKLDSVGIRPSFGDRHEATTYGQEVTVKALIAVGYSILAVAEEIRKLGKIDGKE